MLASVATSDEMKPLVVVLLVKVPPVIVATVAKRLETKEFEEVLLVELSAVIVPDAEVRSVTDAEDASRDEIVVVARVDVPVVVSVPPTTVLPDTVSAVADAVERVV